MPDQSTAATEHAITQDLSSLPVSSLPAALRDRSERPANETKELSKLPPEETQKLIATVVETDFPVVLRGYDRDAVDAYVRRTSRLVAELRATRTPADAVQRALERVGEEVAGILARAHETADEVTARSRKEADERLQRAGREAHEITASAKASLQELDADTDRIWAERHRMIDDARALAEELRQLAAAAAERFPAAEEDEEAAADEAADRAGEDMPELRDDDDSAVVDDEDSAVVSVSRATNGGPPPER